MDNRDWPERRLRHRVQLDAEILYPDGTTARTIVSDLSLDGCRVVGWHRIGDQIELRLPKIGIMRGQVRWAMNGLAGIQFNSSTDA